jgi:hypothetical protein
MATGSALTRIDVSPRAGVVAAFLAIAAAAVTVTGCTTDTPSENEVLPRGLRALPSLNAPSREPTPTPMDLADYGQAGPAGEEEQGVLWGMTLGNHAWKRGCTPDEEDMLLTSLDGQGCGSVKQSEDGRLESTGRLCVSDARAHIQSLTRVVHLEAAVGHNRLRELDTHRQMAALVPPPCLPGHDDEVAETRQTQAAKNNAPPMQAATLDERPRDAEWKTQCACLQQKHKIVSAPWHGGYDE